MDLVVLGRVQRRATGKINKNVFKNHIRRLRDLFHLGKMTSTTMTTTYGCVYLLFKKGACQREKKENNGLSLYLHIS